MSHSVTIRTVTTTNSSAIILNTGYLKTGPGLLKLLELVLGIGIVSVLWWNYQNDVHYRLPLLTILAPSTTFLIGTACLLLSCIVSWSTGGLISKTVFELIYHLTAAIAILVASALLFSAIDNHRHYYMYNRFLFISIAGFVNAILYFLSTLLACRTYRGL